MSRHVSVEGLKIPKKHARDRTWMRWIDPMGREIKAGKYWQPSANPNCTANRNEDRFLKRSIVLKNNIL